MSDKPIGRGAKLAAILAKKQGTGKSSDELVSGGTPPTTARPETTVQSRTALLKLLRVKQEAKAVTSDDAGSSASVSAAEPATVKEVAKSLSSIQLKEPVKKVGKEGRPLPISANVVRLDVSDPTLGVHEYDVRFNPPVDARGERMRILRILKKDLGETTVFDGVLLLLPHKLPDTTTVLQATTQTGLSTTVTVKFQKRRELWESIQLYNILFRRIMEELKFIEVKRNHYNPAGKMMVPAHKLEIWPGFVTSVQQLEGGLMLTCHVTHKVIRNDSALQVLKDVRMKGDSDFRNNAEKALIGSVVMTTYNNVCYRIDSLDFEQTPQNKFLHRATGREMSYEEYYRTHYDIQIHDLKQPLLIFRDVKKNVDEKDSTKLVCLIPELCKMTGLTDAMRSDFRVMKDVALHTRVTPNQRQKALRTFLENVRDSPAAIKHLAAWGLKLASDSIRLDARQLKPRDLVFGKGVKVVVNEKADWGRDTTNNHCLVPVPLKKWHVVFTKNGERVVNGFINLVKSQGPRMGIMVDTPTMSALPNDRMDSYLLDIQKAVDQTPGLQMVVAVMPNQRDDRYGVVKRLCSADIPVPSQVVNLRTISDDRKVTSVVQKIVLQMNCKLGGELWGIDVPVPGLMVVGIDVYHDPSRVRSSVAGIVGSTNRFFSRWHNTCAMQEPGQELIDVLKSGFMSVLEGYTKINNGPPSKVIVYRDGVGDGQLSILMEHEVEQFKECLAHIKPQPTMAFVVVQKRINQRFFNIDGRGELRNPPPGSVVDHTITKREWYDFLLVSQHVTQGTVTPSHYIVVSDDTGLSVDAVQKISYVLTHLYFNWPGTVRVPAPCQYAHKLAYQVGENTRKLPHVKMEDRLHFL